MGWEILTDANYQLFRKSHVAELEVVRSTLPYWLVRGAVDSSGNNETKGYPAAILTNSAAEHYYAFIWYFKHEEQAQPNRFVGFINTAPDIGLRCKSECPMLVEADHELLKDAKILGSDEPWNGPFDPAVKRTQSQTVEPTQNLEAPASPEESTEDQPQADVQASPESGSDESAKPAESTEVVIKTALNKIRKDYKVESDGQPALSAAQRWLRRARNVTMEMDYVERDAVRSRINQEIGNFAFPSNNEETESAKVIITAFDLPFYRGYSLYRLTDRRGLRSKSAYMIMKQPLRDQGSNGTSGDEKEAPVCYLTNRGEPIHAFNKLLIERNELELTRNTIIDYLIFFCRFIYADLGAFAIVEKDVDFRWLLKTDEQQQKSPRAALRKLLEPVRILTPITPRDGDESCYYCGAFVCYGRHLFYAIFKVFFSGANDTSVSVGTVEMIDDEPCVEDLPIFPIAFDRETDFVLRLRPQNYSQQE